MSACTAEVEVSGHLGEHLLAVEFNFELGTSPYLTGGNSSLSLAEYDCGEAPSAHVLTVKMVRHGADKHARRERAFPPAMVRKLQKDKRLELLLVEAALEQMRHE